MGARNGYESGTALYAHHVHPEAMAQIAVGQTLSGECTAAAHCHVGLVQVAHHLVVASTAAEFALVEIVDKLTFHPGHLTSQTLAEIQSGQQHAGGSHIYAGPG